MKFIGETLWSKNPVLTALTGGLNLITRNVTGQDKPTMPDVPKAAAVIEQKPLVMPTPDDEAVKAAKRRQIAEMQARQGRASTILTDSSYGSNKLGGG